MEKSEKTPIQFINESVRKRLTTFGKFRFDSDRDLIIALRAKYILPKEEMFNVSIFDPTYSEIGCELSVRYLERGDIKYDIKKGEYDSFDFYISKYQNFMSNLERETCKYVCCSLKNGFVIPSDKISQNEIDLLLKNYFVTKDRVNGMDWYRISAPDISVFHNYIYNYSV